MPTKQSSIAGETESARRSYPVSALTRLGGTSFFPFRATTTATGNPLFALQSRASHSPAKTGQAAGIQVARCVALWVASNRPDIAVEFQIGETFVLRIRSFV